MFLRLGGSPTIRIGPFLDSTDGNTLETALTINQSDILLSKNGGAFAAKNATGGATADGTTGWYSLALNATDTGTAGKLIVYVKVAGALYVKAEFFVLGTIAYDNLVGTSTSYEGDDIATYGPQLAEHVADYVPAGTNPSGSFGDRIDAKISSSAATWTETEKGQMRYRLGIDGTTSAPTASPNLGISTLADIKAAVKDIFFTDPDPELVTVPAANAPLAQKIHYGFIRLRNRRVVTKLSDTTAQADTYQDDGTTLYSRESISMSASVTDTGEDATA